MPDRAVDRGAVEDSDSDSDRDSDRSRLARRGGRWSLLAVLGR